MYTNPDLVNVVFANQQELDESEREQVKEIEKNFTRPEINTQLNGAYDVPFDDYPDTPKPITMIATKLTAYYFVVFPGSGGSDNFDYARELYDQATSTLESLADGDITLSDLDQNLDDSSFDFDGAKSEAFYNKAIFMGSLENPNAFGDISDTIDPQDDSTTIGE